MQNDDRTVSPVIGLESLWSKTLGDPGICIALLDGPVDLGHPCFVGAELTRIETLVPSGVGNDDASVHGTHVASVIFGQHNSPVKGIAPRCRGLIIPIYSGAAADSLACSQLDLARAINQAVANGAHVINISGGELAQSGAADPILTEAIKSCTESGVLIVAAAGNNGCRCLHVPAAVPSVLAVGAMDAKGSPLEFSNWGDVYQVQGVLAPGEHILGALPAGRTGTKSGTSFATPIVSGIAGLLLSVQLARQERPDPQKVGSVILETAYPCDPNAAPDCSRFLAGRLNAQAACFMIEGKSPERQITQSASNHPRHKGAPAPRIAAVEAGSDSVERARDAAATGLHGTASAPISPASVAVGAGMKRIGCNCQSSQNTLKKEKIMSDENQTTTPNSEPSAASGLGTNDGSVQSVVAAEHPAFARDSGSPVASTRASESSLGSHGSLPDAILPSEVEPAECATCAGAKGSGNSGGPALVYALGQVGYDFGTEARRDSFVQQTGKNVHDAAELLSYLQEDPASAANIIWTLSLDATVVYAIQPFGPFASLAYNRLLEALKAQLTEGVERVSIPGYTRGSVRLLNGQQVPVIYPEVRGIYSWSTPRLVHAVLGQAPKEKEAAAKHAEKAADIQNFLERVYYEIRNLGITSQERAMNYAATNAFQVEFVFDEAIRGGLKLDTIGVEKSPICRPGSDCWDVKLTFFNPTKRLEQARHVHRFTVDVSDVVPVTVGKVRHWDMY